jgi:hypothetical protein
MTLPSAEVPGNRNERGNEALPPITKLNRGLYELIFYILGIALLLLILGWILLAVTNKSVPDGVPVVIATIVGALVGAISSDKAR